MGDLIQEKCVACRRDAPRLNDSQIAHLKPETPEWQVLTEEDILHLNRVFSFKNFAEALVFTRKVGELAGNNRSRFSVGLTRWKKLRQRSRVSGDGP